jgi:hypothetical protein
MHIFLLNPRYMHIFLLNPRYPQSNLLWSHEFIFKWRVVRERRPSQITLWIYQGNMDVHCINKWRNNPRDPSANLSLADAGNNGAQCPGGFGTTAQPRLFSYSCVYTHTVISVNLPSDEAPENVLLYLWVAPKKNYQNYIFAMWIVPLEQNSRWFKK